MTPFLEPERLAEHRWRNTLHSVLLVGGIGILTLLSSILVWSWIGVLVAMVAVASVALLGPRVAPETVMRVYRGELVDPRRGGQLARLVEVLADRAELPVHPRLYVIPSAALNAFATGKPGHAAIGITEGLLRRLSMREVAGVLAHEMSHIRNNDLFVLGLADAMTRFTQALAYVAVFLAVLNVPAMLLGLATFSWIAIGLLYLAPTVASLMQLALSRAREYDADREAAGLTGDPLGLASALRTVERQQGHFWEDLMMPVPARRIPVPSLLRSHPDTEDRVARLLDLSRQPVRRPVTVVEEPMISLVGVAAAQLAPRYRWPGVWY